METNRFRSSFGRCGASCRSGATRCQPPTTLGDPTKLKKQRRHARGDREVFAKFSGSFGEVFASLLKFFEVFVGSDTCLDLFGPAWMCSDVIGRIRKRSDGRVCVTYRRSHGRQKSPKCALSSRLVVVVALAKKTTTGFAGNKRNNTIATLFQNIRICLNLFECFQRFLNVFGPV